MAKPGEDDLEIILDDDPTPSGVPGDDAPVIGDHQQVALQSTALPDEDEPAPQFSDDPDEPSRAPAAHNAQHAGEAEDGAEHYDNTHEQVQAAHAQARQAHAQAKWTEARSQAAVVEQQGNSIKVGLDALKLRFDGAERELANARAAGTVEGERYAREVERDIREMEDLKRELEGTLRQLPDPQAILAQGQQEAQRILNTEPQGKRVGNGITARHPLAERWANQNPWMKTHASANRFVIGQSQRMHEEGWDQNSPGFYHELAKRVQNAYPKLKVSSLQAQRRGAAQQQVRSPVAGTRSSVGATAQRAGGQSAPGKTYRLTVEEQGKMKRMRLDPQDPQHQKAWAKARMESARRMGQQ